MPNLCDGSRRWAAALGAVVVATALDAAVAFGAPSAEVGAPRRLQQTLTNQSVRVISCAHKCLDVAAGSQTNGNSIQLWDCYDEEMDQRFDIPKGVTGHIAWTRYPEKCIQVGGDGRKIELWDCEDSGDQSFTMGDDGYIRWSQDSSKCFNIDQGLVTNGNSISLWDCDTASINQRFANVQPPAVLTGVAQGCPEGVMDSVATATPPMLTEQECSEKCQAEPSEMCSCAVYRAADGRCLMQQTCPDLPEEFPVDGLSIKLLRRTSAPDGLQVQTTTNAATTTTPTTSSSTSATVATTSTPPATSVEVEPTTSTTTDTTTTKTTTTETTTTDTTTAVTYTGSTTTVTTQTTTTTSTSTVAGPVIHTTFISMNNGSGILSAQPWYFVGVDDGGGSLGPAASLAQPQLSAPPMGDAIEPGTIFEVSEVRTDDDGVRFLRLAGADRWVPDRLASNANATSIRFQAQRWRHLPLDGLPMKLLSAPTRGAFLSGTILQPDQEFRAVQQLQDKSGTLWLKLENNAGWAYQRDAKKKVVCQPVEVPLWECDPRLATAATLLGRRLPAENSSLTLLAQPALGAQPLTGTTLTAGQIFEAVEQRVGEDNIDFLRPDGEEGWVPVRTNSGRLCKPIVSEDFIFDQKEEAGQPRRRLPILSGPSPDAKHTGGYLRTGEVFRVASERVSGGKKMLKLADGRGWVAESNDKGRAVQKWPVKEKVDNSFAAFSMLALLAVMMIVCCLGIMLAMFLRGESQNEIKPLYQGYKDMPPIAAAPPPQSPRETTPIVEQMQETPRREDTPGSVGPKVPHLALTFTSNATSTDEQEFFFTKKPLGFTFPLEAPIVVDGFTDDGHAFGNGMRLGMKLTHMGNIYPHEVLGKKYYVGNADHSTVWKALKDAVARLPLEEGAVDYAGKVNSRPQSPRSSKSPSPRNGQSTPRGQIFEPPKTPR